MTAVTLEAVSKSFPDGTVAVDSVDLHIADGEVMVLLGPSGCGKSTILRMIAGLEDPTDGLVLFGDEVANGWLPRERRVAMAFQDFALYPHMTVRGNMGFPLRLSGTDPAAIEERVSALGSALGIGHAMDRRPAGLSGGEKQRVSMGRAIVREPQVFLLDEPLSNLDSALRHGLRAEISSLVRSIGVTTVYVTHDQTEALTMADRITILRDGRVQQIGGPADVYRTPASVYVAAFLGTPRMNLLAATVYAYLDDRVTFDLGDQHLAMPWSDPRARELSRYHGEHVIVGLRAEAISAVSDGMRGALRGTVRYAEHLGHETIAYLDIGASDAPDLDALTGTTRKATAEPGALRRWRLWGRRGTGRAAVPTDGSPGTGRHGQRPAEFAVRLPPYAKALPGETIGMRVDLDQLHVFDRTGRRIHTVWHR